MLAADAARSETRPIVTPASDSRRSPARADLGERDPDSRQTSADQNSSLNRLRFSKRFVS